MPSTASRRRRVGCPAHQVSNPISSTVEAASGTSRAVVSLVGECRYRDHDLHAVQTTHMLVTKCQPVRGHEVHASLRCGRCQPQACLLER